MRHVIQLMLDAGATSFDSGGCLGVDGVMTRLAAEAGLQTTAYLATDTRQTDWAALKAADTVLIRTGLGLRERNQPLVDGVQRMYAIGLRVPSLQPRSGTWACARIAQAQGKLDTVVVLRVKHNDGPLVISQQARMYCLCNTARCSCRRLKIV